MVSIEFRIVILQYGANFHWPNGWNACFGTGYLTCLYSCFVFNPAPYNAPVTVTPVIEAASIHRRTVEDAMIRSLNEHKIGVMEVFGVKAFGPPIHVINVFSAEARR
jgi:hypothetical protein